MNRFLRTLWFVVLEIRLSFAQINKVSSCQKRRHQRSIKPIQDSQMIFRCLPHLLSSSSSSTSHSLGNPSSATSSALAIATAAAFTSLISCHSDGHYVLSERSIQNVVSRALVIDYSWFRGRSFPQARLYRNMNCRYIPVHNI